MSDSIDRQTARALLRGSVVCDMTLPLIDIPGADMRKKLASLERYAAAGFDFVSVTVAVDDADPAEAIRLIARERRFYEDRPDQFILVETAADIDRARRDGKLAVGFHFQGTGPIGRNLDLVALYYKLGIRHMLMAYNQKNLVGNGCHELSDDGLSRFGHSLIAEMNRVGMLVDVAHCGYQTAMQTIDASQAPVVVSHGNVAAIFEHPRAYRDDQIRAVAASGGVIGLTGIGIFMGDNDASVGTYVRSLDHVVQMLGPDHVGFGFDYIYDMPALVAFSRTMAERFPKEGGYTRADAAQLEPEQVIDIVEALIRLGYDDDAVRKIIGGNWHRIMTDVWA
ncbi:MAG: membrane dipeptidase [Rhodobacteraceae bacterium]|nr:membrane dipeptidase [Paracoccaceae bacterium]